MEMLKGHIGVRIPKIARISQTHFNKKKVYMSPLEQKMHLVDVSLHL